MKKSLIKKIFETILWCIIACFFIYLFYEFMVGYILMDDDIMFANGLLLVAFTCLMVVIIIITIAICSIWENKKRKKKNGKTL